VEQAEMDEMWSFVGSKSQQRWLWHAIDHHTGQIFAYVFGTRGDETFVKLKELLAPFGQYRRQLSRIDSMVNPPECSHVGHDLINKKRIERFRKQL
jgi:IS1 family transposase